MTRQQLLRGRFASDAVIAGRYEIGWLIGQGGMAEVYSAYDRALARPVALKVLREPLSEDRRAVARFRREARAVAALAHPGIVAIYDVGTVGRSPFMVMELVGGEPLSEVIRREAPVAPARAAAIGRAVAQALAFAHDAGIVHRDVKPGNVMIGPGDSVKVLDFGIARALGWTPLTDARPVQATAAYASPEQFRGLPLDARSDLYSLGVVLYEMLTGVAPFQGETIAALAYKHVEQPPPPLRALRPAIPPALEAVVARCLAKDRDRRPRSAGELAAELKAASQAAIPLSVPDPVHVDSPPPRTVPVPPVPLGVPVPRTPAFPDERQTGPTLPSPRRRAMVAALTAMAVVAATAAGGLYLMARTSPRAGSPRAGPSETMPPPTTPAPPPPLFAPTALRAAASCDGFLKARVTVTWAPSTSPIADGYLVYRSTSGGDPFRRIARVEGRTTTSFLDHHLNTSQAYFYEVRATADGRLSAASAATSTDTPFLCLS